MNRETLKAEIIDYMKSEIGNPSSIMITQTFKAIKSSVSYGDIYLWASQHFSASRQSKMVEFAIMFKEVVAEEDSQVDSIFSEFYSYCSARFDDEDLDSSGLPWLSGSDAAVNWASNLRRDAVVNCNLPGKAESMKAEILRERTAIYWIKNYK